MKFILSTVLILFIVGCCSCQTPPVNNGGSNPPPADKNALIKEKMAEVDREFDGIGNDLNDIKNEVSKITDPNSAGPKATILAKTDSGLDKVKGGKAALSGAASTSDAAAAENKKYVDGLNKTITDQKATIDKQNDTSALRAWLLNKAEWLFGIAGGLLAATLVLLALSYWFPVVKPFIEYVGAACGIAFLLAIVCGAAVYFFKTLMYIGLALIIGALLVGVAIAAYFLYKWWKANKAMTAAKTAAVDANNAAVAVVKAVDVGTTETAIDWTKVDSILSLNPVAKTLVDGIIK